MFEQSWRTLSENFYDPKFHGADWKAVRAKYQPMVAHVAQREDLYALVSLMLGELNASHLGISGPLPDAEEPTAELGLVFDEKYEGPGLKIAEVLKGGPADRRGINLKPGEVIVSIDRQRITPETEMSRLLNGKVGETVSLEVTSEENADSDDAKTRHRVDLQAVSRSQVGDLMYERWVEHNAREVASLSDGKLGYVHIAGMDEKGLERFVRTLYSDCFDKDAIVIDVRYNGGGFTHDQILNYLGGKEHTFFRQRNGGEGLVMRNFDRKWTKPMVVLVNNRSFSDAEIFPAAFRTLGLGKVVGQATGGQVIGTSSVRLIDGSTLRVPRTGVFTAQGVNMEREGVVPDVAVEPTPEQSAKGIDVQLEKAVDVLQRDVVAWKKARNSQPRTDAATPSGGNAKAPGGN
jgi:tricorn protease